MTYTRRNTLKRIAGLRRPAGIVRPMAVCHIVFKLPAMQRERRA